jgi:hypothetical protein
MTHPQINFRRRYTLADAEFVNLDIRYAIRTAPSISGQGAKVILNAQQHS